MTIKTSRIRLPVGIKLLLSFTVVFWLSVILLTTMFFFRFESTLISESTKLARAHLEGTNSVLNERFLSLQNVLKNFSSRPEITAAFEETDRGKLHDELVRLATINPHTQILIAMDNNFRVLARTNDDTGDLIKPTQNISTVLVTGRAVASIELIDGGFLDKEGGGLLSNAFGSGIAQICITPVKSGNKVIGTIMGGILLSNDPWVGNTSFERFGVDTALFAGKRIESSLLHATSSLPRSIWSTGQSMPETVKENIILGRPFSGAITLGENKAVVAFEPIRDSTSRIIGAVGVSLPDLDIRTQVVKEILFKLSIAAFIGLVVSLLITVVATRDITRPLLAIIDAMHKFGSGQTGTRVTVDTGDEFEQLADGFNNMSDDIRRREDKLNKHYQVAKLLMSTLDLENLVKKMLEIVVDVTESQMGIIYLHDPNTRLLVPSATFGIKAGLTDLKADEGYPGQAATLKELLLIRPAFETDSLPSIDLGFTDRPPHQLAYIPLICKEKLLGTMVLGKVEDYSDEEQTLFDYLANQLAIALDNAILHKHVHSLSITDGLTGLYNRHYLNEFLNQKWSLATRHNRPLAVILGDLDNFKSINDTHGHAHGDDVLRLTGKVISQTIRNEDLGARYGGEEFVVIMDNTSAQVAIAQAERIAVQLKEADLPWLDRPLTVSFGVAIYQGGNFQTAEELLQAADRSMYEAKAGGKDRVALYPINK